MQTLKKLQEFGVKQWGINMRKEDRTIHYRPELAGLLQIDLDFMQSYYKLNFQMVYYRLKAMLLEMKINQKKESQQDVTQLKEIYQMFQTLAELLEKTPLTAYEYFDLNQDKFEEYGENEIIKPATAFRNVCRVYQNEFDTMRQKYDSLELTRMERFMVNDFYNKLFSPLRNPNIESNGKQDCYYNEPGNYGKFERDLKSNVEYFKPECEHTIELFNTPD